MNWSQPRFHVLGRWAWRAASPEMFENVAIATNDTALLAFNNSIWWTYFTFLIMYLLKNADDSNKTVQWWMSTVQVHFLLSSRLFLQFHHGSICSRSKVPSIHRLFELWSAKTEDYDRFTCRSTFYHIIRCDSVDLVHCLWSSNVRRVWQGNDCVGYLRLCIYRVHHYADATKLISGHV